MLDIKFLRENPDVVKQNIKNKFQDSKLPLVDEVIELDKRNREIKGEVEALRAEKNKISKMIGTPMNSHATSRLRTISRQKKSKQEQAKWINLKNNKRLAVTDREAADKYISAMN